MSTTGKIIILFGWVLIALSVMALIGIIQQPHQRDRSIDAFLKHPNNPDALFGTIGYILGSNIFTIPALLIGICTCCGKNPKGKHLLIISILLFSIVSGILFLPSSSSAEQDNFVPFYISPPHSEFQVIFPHPVQKRVVSVGQIESIVYESIGPTSNPYLRAEFIPNLNLSNAGKEFRTILVNHAHLSGLQSPEILVTENAGTFSGTKTVGNIEVFLFGMMLLGDHSAINCLIVENLDKFPSKDSVIFLSSIKKSDGPSVIK